MEDGNECNASRSGHASDKSHRTETLVLFKYRKLSAHYDSRMYCEVLVVIFLGSKHRSTVLLTITLYVELPLSKIARGGTTGQKL